MGNFNISAVLKKAGERQWDDRTLVQESTELAENLLNDSARKISSDERSLLSALEKVAADAKNKEFLLTLCNRVLHSNTPQQQSDNLKKLLADFGGIPTFFSGIARLRFRAASALSLNKEKNGIVHEVHHLIRSTFKDLTLAPSLEKADKKAREWAKDKVALAVSPLSPTVFGYSSAEQYYHFLEAIQSRQTGLGIVIQPWRLCPELTPYAPETGIKNIADKLRTLLRLSMGGGLSTPVIVETGTSDILPLIIEAFLQVMSEEEFFRVNAMPELPAYLKSTPALLHRLTDWSAKRVAKGALPLKVLLVKGSHLDKEKSCAFLYGSEHATAASKADTDARFKQLVATAIKTDAKTIIPVIGTHNLFDLSYALLCWGRHKRVGLPHFVFKGGLGNHLARYLAKEGASVTLTVGMASDLDNDSGFEQYLTQLVSELSRPDGYLTNGYAPKTDSMGWTRMRQQFLASASGRKESETEQLKAIDSLIPGTLSHVTNAARTAEFFDRAGQETKQIEIPLLIGGEEKNTPLTCIKRSLTAPGVEDYRFTSADFSLIDDVLRLAQSATAKAAERTPEQRSTIALTLAKKLQKNRVEIEALLVRDAGFNYRDAEHELLCATDTCYYYEQNTDRTGLRDGTYPISRGIVVVTPGNIHPLADAVSGIIAALLTGNVVIYKPSAETVLLGQRIAELIKECGVEEPEIQFLPCLDNQISTKLMASPHVKAIFADGEAVQLRQLKTAAPAAAIFNTPHGTTTAYLSDTADWQQAVRDLTESVFRRSGQCPTCPHIVLVHAGVYDNPDFSAALKDALHLIKAAPGWREEATLGPLAARLPEEALYQLTHTNPGESWLVEPTTTEQASLVRNPGIRIGVQADSPLLGYIHKLPLMALIRVESTEQATLTQQQLSAGKAAIIYTTDDTEADTWKQAMHTCCNVGINCCPSVRPALQPFGSQSAVPTASQPVPGSRNFLIYLNRWEENARPQKRGKHSVSLFVPWESLSPKPAGDDSMRLSAAAGSLSYWWENEFGELHDISSHPEFSTTMRYLPCPVCIRAEAETADTDLSIAIMAALKADCNITLSTATLRPWMARSLEGLGIRLKAESREDYLRRMPELAAKGITVRDPLATDADLARAAACRLKVVREPIVANGRIELLHYLREQYITEKR